MRRAITWIVLTLTAAVAAGCGTGHAPRRAAPVRFSPPPSLALSITSSPVTWAAVEMGGSAASNNNFWQLFARVGQGGRWRLATPGGMATNGGFILADPAGESLLTAFRPSQEITFSPLVRTEDAGARWTAARLAAGLADVPDALAVSPADGTLIALTHNTITTSRKASGWTTIGSLKSLAASAAGRACHLTSLTAVAFSPAGLPLAAGSCSRPGIAGIFAYSNGAWRAAGPALPATVAGQPATVLRLTASGGRQMALLAAGGAARAVVLAAWSGTGGDSGWTLSPPLATGGTHVLSASFGPGGSVALVMAGNRGEVLAGPSGTWSQPPALSAGSQVLVTGGSGHLVALASHRSVLTVWAAGPADTGWASQQVIKVPIQYGSSS